MSATTANIPMPARGDRSAPRFDPKQPRELRRYFTDLAFHFNRGGVTDDAEKKKHACRYVDVDTSELWESLPEFSNAATTYAGFATAIYALYPGSEEERKWTVADMDQLVGERSRLGILSLADLGDYYRHFLAITTFLKRKSRLSDAEQSRAFARGFQAEMWTRVSQRLQLKFPDHDPDDPYPIDAIHEAARYVLHGTPSTLLTTIVTATAAAPSTTTDPASVKTEAFAAILEKFTESFKQAVAMQNVAPFVQGDRPRPAPMANPACNFCGGLDHFIRDCQIVAEFMRAGKCTRNVEGKVTLPSGAFVPREIPGRWLKDRIDEWHRRNPNQLAAAQMMYRVLANEIAQPEPARVTIATRDTGINLLKTTTPSAGQLSAQERIESLERELFQLRGRDADRPRTRAARAAAQANHSTPIQKDSDESAPPRSRRIVPEVVIPRVPARQEPVEPVVEESTVPAEPPVHPFADARDATYAVPQERNFAALPKPSPAKKAEPAYRTFPPVYDGKVAADVYNRAMASQVMVTQRELLSLSPEVRAQIREAVSAKRSVTKEAVVGVNALVKEEELVEALDDLDVEEETEDSTPAAVFTNAICQQSVLPPPGSLIIPDPYETYLKTLPEGEEPVPLVVAKESSALRSIFPLVDNQQRVEAIVDPGSQIIAMAEEVCIDLALAYDPTIILNMQSANGEVDKSLGLARNVPMRIGEITLYVQIHIIRSPAYDILLGRPFDILTESVVRNYANEDQTITICDPNSGRRSTVPTSPRGRPRRLIRRMDFSASMN